MRYLILFALPLAMAAQPADSGDKLTQALISEIQQLRLAIERSTLLGARTQLAISQFQMQETAMARLSQQFNDVRMQGTSMAGNRARLTESLRDAEQRRTSPEFSAGPKKDQLELEIKGMKLELEHGEAVEMSRAAREGELASQVQATQAQMAESRARISELERALDAAIQQLLKK